MQGVSGSNPLGSIHSDSLRRKGSFCWSGYRWQARWQILRRPEDLSPSDLARKQQPPGCQFLEITAGGLMADAMAVLVGEHRIAEARMPQRTPQQGQLAMV